MKLNKAEIVKLFDNIRDIAEDPINSPIENRAYPQDYIDPASDDLKLKERVQDSCNAIKKHIDSIFAQTIPGATPENDDPNDYEILRHPVFLSDSTCILITTFRSANHLSHLFLTDYIDYRKQTKVAARDLIAQIGENLSVDMCWCLKEAIDEQIEKRNEMRVKHDSTKRFTLNRPKEDQEIDYKDVLKSYMQFVYDDDGSTFIDHLDYHKDMMPDSYKQILKNLDEKIDKQ